MKLKWSYQVAESVDVLHNNGAIHCDINPRNFLLDTRLDIKIIDFSGSSVDGSKPASGEGTRFYLPQYWRDQPTVATGLFALGSTIYEIFQGTSPYAEVPSDEVGKLFAKKEFPDISQVLCGQTIKQCWLSQVDSAADVQTASQISFPARFNIDCISHLDGLDTGQDINSRLMWTGPSSHARQHDLFPHLSIYSGVKRWKGRLWRRVHSPSKDSLF